MLDSVSDSTIKDKRERWFEDFIHSIKVDQLALETGVISDDKKNFYEAAFSGITFDFVTEAQRQMHNYLIVNILRDYLQEIVDFLPQKIAFDVSGSEVLAWMEINDNDFETEKKLLLAEAKVNSIYHSKGFDLNSLIVEVSDQLTIPEQYSQLKM